MLARTALGGIWVYQTYLSPRKGFRCAHSVLHGGTGCSGFAKQAIREHGAIAAIPLVRDRFRACKTAHYTLRDDHDDKRKRRRKKSSWTDACFCLAGEATLLSCAPGRGSGDSGGGGDASGFDCDAVNCSGCDAINCGGFDGCSCS